MVQTAADQTTFTHSTGATGCTAIAIGFQPSNLTAPNPFTVTANPVIAPNANVAGLAATAVAAYIWQWDEPVTVATAGPSDPNQIAFSPNVADWLPFTAVLQAGPQSGSFTCIGDFGDCQNPLLLDVPINVTSANPITLSTPTWPIT